MLRGAIMGLGEFARTRGALLSKFSVVIGALSIVGACSELARAADNTKLLRRSEHMLLRLTAAIRETCAPHLNKLAAA